jgi:orotidine-5'-phosphate decarboxylase
MPFAAATTSCAASSLAAFAIRVRFAGVLHQVLPSSSREILGAGPDPAALRAAAEQAAATFAALVA